MTMMPDYRSSDGKLPNFAQAEDALAETLDTLTAPARVPVSKAAETYRRIDSTAYRGPWRNEVAPYMVEPMDMLGSRRFTVEIMVGPARSAKTDSLILNPVVHAVMCNPRNMLLVHISKDSARDFSLEKLSPMIAACPEVRARQMTTRGGDNIFDKRFAGGMRVSIGWPVLGKLSARDLPFVAFTDYDRMDDDVGEEGQPFALGRKRTLTFGSLGMTVVESSPGRPILDENWSPKTPHEAPPTTGVLALYNRGTRGRFYWRCPSCDVEFEPTFDRLRWPEGKATAAEIVGGTFMVCPNGCVIESTSRNELNAGGRWLHETDAGKLAPITGKPRTGEIVSYWLQGPAAAFQSWGELAHLNVEALAEFETTGEETALQATVNLDQGRPHLPRALGDTAALSEQVLKARALRYETGTAPAATRFITVQVDVQASRFVVHVDAWGEGLERWLVDRFELHEPPADAPGAARRALDPARYGEDWAVLEALKDRVVPVAKSDLGLRPVMVTIDSGGAPGVTDRAYTFWRRMKREGFGNSFRLLKGVGGFRARRAIQGFPETAHGGKKKAARDIPIITAAVDRLKDEISAALTRDEPGPGSYHLPEGIDPAVFSELAAERRTAKGWERKAGGRRNEALDLAVYGKATAIVMKAERINWTRPPAWAAPVGENVMAVVVDESNNPKPVVIPKPRRQRRIISRGV